MASTKVVLRTPFQDVFEYRDYRIVPTGTELPSRKVADEVLEAARLNGVTLYEVEEPQSAAPEGSGN